MDSKTVFELRKVAKDLLGELKVNKLNEALKICNDLYHKDQNDEWTQKAFAWTLIDLCKYYVSIGNFDQALRFYTNLQSINLKGHDELIEKQKKYLHPQIDSNFGDINKAEELSKNGKHKEAINVFTKLLSENRLSELHHESYGWVIYRYIKSETEGLTSIEIRKFLRDYMNLKNERPSLLHSMVLNFAMTFSKEHSDFNLYKFFKLWNPKNLRKEDKEIQSYEGKKIPSLISRVIREFVDKDYDYEVEYLMENIDMGNINNYSFDDDLPF